MTWLVAVALTTMLSTAAVAKTLVPAHDGWVTDQAGFLSPSEERALEVLMESFEQGSDHEIALLTVQDLGGVPIDQYALDVAREWGIGKEGRHNGALLVVARSERKIRIEVGRGLEGTLTDSISGRIIRDVISVEFKRGNYPGGLRAGIEAMHAAAGGDYAKIPTRSGRSSEGGSAFLGLLPLVFFVILALSRGRRGGGGGGMLTWLLLGSMLGSSHRGGGRTSGWHGGGGFSGFGGGGGFSGGGASGSW